MRSPMNRLPPIKLPDQDNTSAQGFEKAANNVLYVDINDCSHCLRPFNEIGRFSNRVNVITDHGKDIWCGECADKGAEEGICVKESRLTKEEKKLWEKKLKKAIGV